MNRFRPLLLLAVAVLAATPAVAQTLDFTRYVAIGDSLTAGYSDNGLAERTQRYSYPALIWSATHNGSFTGFEQPLVSNPGIPAQLQLVSIAPNIVIAPRPGQGQPLNLNLPRAYDNMAVPGAKVHDVLATRTGGLNDLILRGLGTQFELAMSRQPTFASVWIGNNDVLGAALGGRVIDGVTLTPTAAFQADYRTIVETLFRAQVEMLLVTIPDVTAIPFVSTVAPIQQVGNVSIPLIGPDGLLTANDRVLLTARALLAQGIGIPVAAGGTGQPLPDQVVLSAAEIAQIRARTAEYNAIIRQSARDTGAALFDVAAFFDEVVAHGYTVGGFEFETGFLTGGFFSLDGVHATQMGYAILANEMIAAINERFNGLIPTLDLRPFFFAGEIPGFSPDDIEDVQISPKAMRTLLDVMGVPRTTRRGPAVGVGGRN